MYYNCVAATSYGMNKSTQNHSLGIGPDKIKKAEEEKKLQALMQLVEEKGIDHAEKVAKKLDDHYVLGRFYEEVAKIEKQKAVGAPGDAPQTQPAAFCEKIDQTKNGGRRGPGGSGNLHPCYQRERSRDSGTRASAGEGEGFISGRGERGT